MRTLYFECQFLSDVILNATSATSGSTQSLEYIPGSKFLGIVAKRLYNNANIDPIALFHNGNVRFGDAHLSKNGVRSLKVPFDFFKEKNADDGKIRVNRFLSKEDRRNLSAGGTQLVQERKSFFINTNEQSIILKNKTFYSIKSAYDANERRTKDKQIFGFNAIKKGSKWLFNVEIEDEIVNYENEIVDALCGEHSLGKSRSAQYGRVFIKQIDKFETTALINSEQPDNLLVLYAESNWCFLDESGQPSVKPTIEQLGLSDGKIDWTKSQIRTRVYTPWNVKRAARDADRWIIEKGSVIVINNGGEVLQQQFEKGIGFYRSEGFGKVLVNPDFLSKKNCLFDKKEVDPDKATEIKENYPTNKNEFISKLLKQRKAKANPKTIISKKVTDFIDNNWPEMKELTASQWGQVRNIAQNVQKEDYLKTLLFDKEVGFLYTAKRAKEWGSKAKLVEKAFNEAPFGDYQDKQNFLIVLASEMAKKTQQKN